MTGDQGRTDNLHYPECDGEADTDADRWSSEARYASVGVVGRGGELDERLGDEGREDLRHVAKDLDEPARPELVEEGVADRAGESDLVPSVPRPRAEERLLGAPPALAQGRGLVGAVVERLVPRLDGVLASVEVVHELVGEGAGKAGLVELPHVRRDQRPLEPCHE